MSPKMAGSRRSRTWNLPSCSNPVICVDMCVDIIYIIYLPPQAAHHHALHRAARGRVAGPGGPGLPPADECC